MLRSHLVLVQLTCNRVCRVVDRCDLVPSAQRWGEAALPHTVKRKLRIVPFAVRFTEKRSGDF